MHAFSTYWHAYKMEFCPFIVVCCSEMDLNILDAAPNMVFLILIFTEVCGEGGFPSRDGSQNPHQWLNHCWDPYSAIINNKNFILRLFKQLLKMNA
jgi:hypothetical protein